MKEIVPEISEDMCQALKQCGMDIPEAKRNVMSFDDSGNLRVISYGDDGAKIANSSLSREYRSKEKHGADWIDEVTRLQIKNKRMSILITGVVVFLMCLVILCFWFIVNYPSIV